MNLSLIAKVGLILINLKSFWLNFNFNELSLVVKVGLILITCNLKQFWLKFNELHLFC